MVDLPDVLERLRQTARGLTPAVPLWSEGVDHGREHENFPDDDEVVGEVVHHPALGHQVLEEFPDHPILRRDRDLDPLLRDPEVSRNLYRRPPGPSRVLLDL